MAWREMPSPWVNNRTGDGMEIPCRLPKSATNNDIRHVAENGGVNEFSRPRAKRRHLGQSGYLGALYTWKNGSSRDKKLGSLIISESREVQGGNFRTWPGISNKSGNGGESIHIELLQYILYATFEAQILRFYPPAEIVGCGKIVR
jgi:hypothetical protein